MISLRVLTPSGVAFEGEVDRFTVPSLNGPLQISGGYTPIFEILQDSGVLKIQKGNRVEYFAIFLSSLRVEPMKAVLCCQNVESGHDIDKARARASLDRATVRLEEKKEDLDIARAKASMARALARLEAKSLSEGSKSI